MDTDKGEMLDEQKNAGTEKVEDDPVVDERSDIDKRLEEIESIERHDTAHRSEVASNTSTAEDASDDIPVRTEEKVSDSPKPSEPATPTRDAELDREEAKKQSALVAARENMNSARKGDDSVKKQRSRTWVIVLLLVLLLAAIGSAIWFFTREQQAATQLSSAQTDLSLTQQELGVLKKKQADTEAAMQAEEDATDAVSQAPVKKYREIPEWDVRYEVTEANKDIAYGLNTIQPKIESFGFFSLSLAREAGIHPESQQLACGIGSAGLVNRMSDATYQEQFAQAAGVLSKKIGEYYYVFMSPQGVCKEDATAKQTASSEAVRAILQSFEPLTGTRD